MPTYYRDKETPVVQFDPLLEMSPFTLFRRLREERAPLLVDVRAAPGRLRLTGAVEWPGEEWAPPDDRDTVLFDDDGSEALPIAIRLQGEGHERVRLLFGGLELYEFSLDPAVVGEETYLTER